MCQNCAKPAEPNSLVPCSFVSPFYDFDDNLATTASRPPTDAPTTLFHGWFVRTDSGAGGWEASLSSRRTLEARRKAAEGGLWLFPRCASDKEVKAACASNALGKWLRTLDRVSRDKRLTLFATQ